MNLLFLNLSSGWGGLEMFSANIFSWLKHEKWQVDFIVGEGSALHRSLEMRGYEVHTVRGVKYVDPRVMRFVRRFVVSNHIDIVHTFKSSDIWTSVLATRFLKRKPKLVHHLQLIPKHFRKGFFRSCLYRRLDRVVAISGLVEREAKIFWPVEPEKYRLLRNAIDTSYFFDKEAEGKAFREEHNIPLQATLLGQVGQICPIKGQRFVLEAAKPLLKADSELYMVIAGTPPPGADSYASGIEDFIEEHSLQRQVKMIGFCSNTPALFSALDIFVLGSVYEPFGLVLLEAMSCGCLALASDAGGVPEIIRHQQNGLLYQANSMEGLRDILEKALLLNQEQRRTLVSAGRKTVSEHFSIPGYLQGLRDIYAEVIQGCTPRSSTVLSGLNAND